MDKIAYDKWDEFLKEWPLDRVRGMPIDDYVIGSQESTFCYWLEYNTIELGRFNGPAFKAGIFKNDDPKLDGRGRKYLDGYAFFTKFGETPDEAFGVIRDRLVAVIEAIQQGDLDAVEQIDLGSALKWKIAFLYQSRASISVLPIYTKEILLYHYSKLNPSAKANTSIAKLQQSLVDHFSDDVAEDVIVLM
jgi:5-methylcytosine-specific restriction protein B